MKIIAVRNTVSLVTNNNERLPLVTLSTAAQALHALKWTRRFDNAAEGATGLITYCNDKGMKPRGRKVSKKRCADLAGLKIDWR